MELLEENAAILPVVRAVMNESTRPLAWLVVEALLPPNGRKNRLLRILAAVLSKRVNDAIADGMKDAAAKRPTG